MAKDTEKLTKPKEKGLFEHITGETVKQYAIEKSKSIGRYFWKDILLPTIKDMLSQAYHGAGDIIFDKRPGSTAKRSNGSTAYSSRYKSSSSTTRGIDYRPARRSAATIDYEDIMFETPKEAEDVLVSLESRMRVRGEVSINDYYGLVDTSLIEDWTLDNYGWSGTLGNPSIVKVGGLWKILLPKATLIRGYR